MSGDDFFLTKHSLLRKFCAPQLILMYEISNRLLTCQSVDLSFSSFVSLSVCHILSVWVGQCVIWSGSRGVSLTYSLTR